MSDGGQLISLADVPDIPYSADYVAPEKHSWQPQSLVDMAANPPEPPSIGGLLYPGKRTVLSGETESMKTWLALILCKAELDLGRPVIWTDLDAMGPGSMLERLQLLGCPDDQIHDQFLYIQPSEMLDPAKIAETSNLVADRGVRLFVIDAFNPFLSMHGLEPNSTPDIDTFWRTIADPICHAGAAPVMLDHVVKNSENRGKYAYGSERKASGAIVHIGFRILEPLVKGGKGRALLTVHKDRPGYLPRPVVGRLILVSDGTSVTYELEPDHSHDTGKFRPTIYMERVSRRLEPENDPVSTKWLEENVEGNREKIREGIRQLIEEGYVRKTEGERGSFNYVSLRQFRDDGTPSNPDLAPPRPDLAPNLRSHDVAPLAPPLRGRGAMRGGVDDLALTSPALSDYDVPPDSYYDTLELPTDPEEIESPNEPHELW